MNTAEAFPQLISHIINIDFVKIDKFLLSVYVYSNKSFFLNRFIKYAPIYPTSKLRSIQYTIKQVRLSLYRIVRVSVLKYDYNRLDLKVRTASDK